MAETFGDFIDNFPPKHNALELSFMPTSRPIKQRWRNNRLSAHFVADYLSNFLPIDEDDPKGEKRIKESKGAVSYVANELLENAMKFNDEATNYNIKFGIQFIEDDEEVTVALFATNSIKPQGVEKLQAFITELLASDPNELYIRQIEKSAEEEHSGASGLGLLTMINDYSATLGWKFDTVRENPEIMSVTVMAQVVV